MSQIDVVEGELLPECKQRGCATIARPGQVLCDEHAVPQMIAAARRKLALAAPEAAERLIELALHAPSDDVRRRAAESVLDRAGVRGGVELDVTTTTAGASPADQLRERLETLKDRTVGTTQSAILPSGESA